MANSFESRNTEARTEDRPEHHRRAPAACAPTDYDPAYAAKAVGRGIPRDWPFCTCGADVCPDRGLT